MPTRRAFLATLLAASTTPRLGWAHAGSPTCLAAALEADGGFALFGLTAEGAVTFRIPLPARGHAGAGHPHDAIAVAFARRPGTYALVIDCARGTVIERLTPPDNRQFNGHGAFLEDGAVLATSEQRADDSAGRIGLWETTGWTRIGEWDTHGLGPHELRLMPDGATVVVANGGIATDPTDRTKLNLPEMRPNLAYLDGAGQLADLVAPPDAIRFDSIRHLAVRTDGLVGFAMQWEGAADLVTPLLGLHRRGAEPVFAMPPPEEAAAMRGYAGSVAWGAGGDEIAISSPRGARVQRFDATGAFLGALTRADVCGLAPRVDGFMTSDGQGALLAMVGDMPRLLARHPVAWDNHIVSL